MTEYRIGLEDEMFIVENSGGNARGYALATDPVIPRRDPVRLSPTANPKVVLFSCYNRAYAPLAAIAGPNWMAYCRKHGYGLRLYPNGFHLDPSQPATYGDKGKFQWYYDIRGGDKSVIDIIMFLDIDSLFTNMEIEVTDWMDGAPLLLIKQRPVNTITTAARAGVFDKAPFFWTYDDSGPLSGLYIARTDDSVERHLRKAYELAAAENNVRHGQIEPNGISDQDAMRRLMSVPPFRDTFQHCYPAEDVGHCYPENWKPGKWIVTFPGRSFADKLSGMREWARKVPAQ